MDSIRDLVFQSQFASSHERSDAQEKIYNLACEHGAYLASTHNLYMAFARGDISGFTVPAMNIRMFTFDFVKNIFELMITHKVGPVIFELAISEQEYTNQPPEEFVPAILGAALDAGYIGPVFVQGDHYQFKANAYKENPEAEKKRLSDYIERSIKAGMYNIDIDGSTLVDLSQEDLNLQQVENYSVTNELASHIREIEPENITVSIGCEIGHIGDRNSTHQDFEAFISHIDPKIQLSKVAIQTGTSHGGVVNKDGSLADVSIDFDAIDSIGESARAHGLGGVVQHGASTLPEDLFRTFPDHKTLEIHLATEFQNIAFAQLPPDIKIRMGAWQQQNLKSERKPDQSEEQFLYTTRKKAWGPFKEELWKLSGEKKAPVIDALTKKVEKLFNQLNVINTREILDRYYAPEIK